MTRTASRLSVREILRPRPPAVAGAGVDVALLAAPAARLRRAIEECAASGVRVVDLRATRNKRGD